MRLKRCAVMASYQYFTLEVNYKLMYEIDEYMRTHFSPLLGEEIPSVTEEMIEKAWNRTWTEDHTLVYVNHKGQTTDVSYYKKLHDYLDMAVWDSFDYTVEDDEYNEIEDDIDDEE